MQLEIGRKVLTHALTLLLMAHHPLPRSIIPAMVYILVHHVESLPGGTDQEGLRAYLSKPGSKAS